MGQESQVWTDLVKCENVAQYFADAGYPLRMSLTTEPKSLANCPHPPPPKKKEINMQLTKSR